MDRKQHNTPPGGISDRLVLGVLIGLFFGAVAASLYFHFRMQAPELAAWADGFAQNFGTEMFGAFLTFLLIETLLRRRREWEARRQADEERKEALILQMGSPDNGFAVEAARQLEARGWLKDGSLQEAWLRSANLQGAALEHANLQRTLLSCANLQGAKLWSANLQGAKLWSTNLRGAHLERANLQGAALPQANLQGASLIEVDLQGANLGSVNLQGANLWGANLQGAVLMEADLQETHLGSTNLQGANLWGTNLQGAANAKIEQIRQPASLEGATLPDGTKLPDNDSWHEVFEAWCETVQLDDYGYIVPAPLED